MFAQLQATNTNGINNDRNSMLDQIAQDESNEAILMGEDTVRHCHNYIAKAGVIAPRVRFQPRNGRNG